MVNIVLPLLLLQFPKLACGIFALWLYRIWRIKRESAYLWLCWGIGLLPLLYVPMYITLFGFRVFSDNWGYVFHIIMTIFIYGITFVEFFCIAVALHKMYGGAVTFGDLFHPRRCLAAGHTVMNPEEMSES